MMANYFGVTKSDLVEMHISASCDNARKIIPNAKNITPFTPSRIPLVGRIAAGTPILAEHNIDGYENLADCELAWTSFDTAVRRFSFRWHGMLQGNMKEKEERIHPTQKPVFL